MSILIKGMTAEELLDVFQWARIGANNCMIGYGVVATELLDHGDLIDIDSMLDDFSELRDYDFASREYVVILAERNEDVTN